MLYHQMIDIGAYILFLDGLPIEPRSARIVLTGTEDKLSAIGFDIHFRLRDLLHHMGNILQRSTTISDEMVDWFLENVPIHRTVATSFNLNKQVFKQLEENYYQCQTIDQFLKTKLDMDDVVPPLLNIDLYELVGLELVPDEMDEVAVQQAQFSGSDNAVDESFLAYLGVISKLFFVQVGSAIKAALYDLFSVRR
jgi:hypothetical protein